MIRQSLDDDERIELSSVRDEQRNLQQDSSIGMDIDDQEIEGLDCSRKQLKL